MTWHLDLGRCHFDGRFGRCRRRGLFFTGLNEPSHKQGAEPDGEYFSHALIVFPRISVVSQAASGWIEVLWIIRALKHGFGALCMRMSLPNILKIARFSSMPI